MRKIFAGYLTAGDSPVEHFLALVKGGVNLLEIGIPYSDPVADGPVIQQAMQRALQKKTSLQNVLDLVRDLRAQTEVPLILFTYYNPIQARLPTFLAAAKEAGANGILIVDLPLEEADEYRRLCEQHELSPIFVLSPSTPLARIKKLSQAGRGFLYYACRKGTTGEKTGLPPDLAARLQSIRKETTLPLMAGFGIARRQDAEAINKEADGFVVGSHFVRAVANGATAQELEKLCHDLRP